jgi:hypothetical protein
LNKEDELQRSSPIRFGSFVLHTTSMKLTKKFKQINNDIITNNQLLNNYISEANLPSGFILMTRKLVLQVILFPILYTTVMTTVVTAKLLSNGSTTLTLSNYKIITI